MAKKSIGQFIAALRKANGLTQQDVADRLNVSNKAVSRWERGECAPDLSLIPAIAEMFGVTCDELLRGEKNSSNNPAQESKSKIRIQKYRNLTLVSVGLTSFGILAAFVANIAFARGLIAFVLAAAFAVASEICQIGFVRNAGMDAAGIVKITFANLLCVAFCLPSAILIDGIHYGLPFQSWVGYGFLFSLTSFLALYLVYSLVVRTRLIASGYLIYNEAQRKTLARQNRLLKKTAAISVGIACIIGIGIFTCNAILPDSYAKREVFTSPAAFKAYMEREGDKGNRKEYGEIKNSRGEVICRYDYNPDLYFSIRFTDSSDDGTPITVVTWDAVYNAFELKSNIESGLYMLIALNFAIAVGIYIGKASKMQAKEQTKTPVTD